MYKNRVYAFDTICVRYCNRGEHPPGLSFRRLLLFGSEEKQPIAGESLSPSNVWFFTVRFRYSLCSLLQQNGLLKIRKALRISKNISLVYL